MIYCRNILLPIMKPIRLLLKLVLLVLLLIVLSVGTFLLFPGVQTAVARQFIPSDPGTTPKLEHLKISLGGVNAAGFATTLSNVEISLDEADIHMSLWGLLTNRQAHIQSADIRGAKVDISRYTPAVSEVPDGKQPDPQQKKEEEKEPFKGFLSSFRWPEAVIVDEWKADAEVKLKEGETVSLEMAGKELKKAGNGQLNYQIKYHNHVAEAQVDSGTVQGALKWAINPEGYFTSISGLNHLHASGPGFTDPIRLELYLEAKPVATGDAVKLQLSSPDLPQNASIPLSLNAQYRADQDIIEGSFAVLLNLADWHSRLPENLRTLTANIDGQGQFDFSPTQKTGTLNSSGKVNAAGLDRFQASIPEFARDLNLNWQFSASALPSEEVQIDALSVEALLPATGTSFSLRPSSQMKIPFSEPDSLLEEGSLPPLKLAFREITPSLVRPFLPEGMQVGFQAMSGEIDITVHSLDSIAVKPSAPIRLNQLQVRGEGIPEMAPLNFSFTPDILYSPSQIQLAWGLQAAPANPSSTALGIALQWAGKGVLQGQQFSLEHTLNGHFTQLQQLAPQLPAGQSVSLLSKAVLNGSQADDGVRVTFQSLENRIGQGNQTWLILSSNAPWSLQTRSGAAVPEFENLNLNFVVQNLPLQLVTAFVPALEATATASSGDFQLRSQGKGWVLQNQAPLTLEGFSLIQNGEPVLQQINLSAAVNGALDAQNRLNVNIPSVQVSSRQGNLLALQAALNADMSNQEAAEIPWEFELNSEANLALARQQPMLRSFLENVLEGRTRISVKGRYQKTLNINAQVQLQDLRGTQGELSQSLNSSVTASFDPESRKASLDLPLTLTSGSRVSQMNLNGNLTTPGPQGQPGVLNAALKGETLHVRDFMTLAGTLTPTSKPAAQPPTRPTLTGRQPAPGATAQTTPDQEPAWQGWNAQIDVTANRIILPNQTVVDNLVGEFKVTENRAALEQFKGRIQGAPAQLHAGLDFIPNNPQPYRASGSLNLQNLETAGFFPNTASPPLNTRVRAAGNLSGNGMTIPDTIEKLQGQFQVEANEGIIRIFSTNPFLDNITSTLGGLGQLILGQAEILPPEIRALERLSSILSEIPFQQMRFELIRGENLDIQLREIRVTGNEVQLSGQGLISYRANTPITQQPLNLDFQLATRGPTADVFQAAKLIQPLQEGMTNQQFRRFDFPLQLTGSLANINSDAVWRELTNQVMSSLNIGRSRNNATPENQQQQQTPNNQQRNPLEGLIREIFK